MSNPHDLTAIQRDAFIAFFEFVDANHAKHPEGDPMRVGVPGGWEWSVTNVTDGTGVWLRPNYFSAFTENRCVYLSPDEARLIDHQAACHCMSEWLGGQDVFVQRCDDGSWVGAYVGNELWEEGMLDCPDDPLAARLAAAREIEK